MLYLGADHRGFPLKESLKWHLQEQGVACEDYGAAELLPGDDYVDYGRKVAEAVANDPANNRGVLVCGSGVGMDIVANKVRGVHSSLVTTPAQAAAARREDDPNVLVLAADITTPEQAITILNLWLATPFSGEERYTRRLNKLREFEQKQCKEIN